MRVFGTKKSRRCVSLLLVSLVVALSACGSKEKSASQVAAKVNSDEISVHQINQALGRSDLGNVTPEQIAQVRREVLDKLIDQQLFVGQAIEKKLDRSPNVMMAIEAARREILSRAFIEQLSSSLPKPTEEEMKKYYTEHPQLFAERRVYNLQEILVPADAKVSPQLRELMASGKSMEDIAKWLSSKDVKFTGGSATRAAEQIPLELLPRLHALKDGQGMVIDGPQNTTIMRLAASQAAPVPEAQALPRIAQYLGNQRLNEALERELKQIKDKAKIVYVGDFAKDGEAPATAKQKEQPKAEKKADASMEKGVAGLK